MQEYWQVGCSEPGLLLRAHIIMDRYPAYTVAALLAEDPRIVEGLYAQAQVEAKCREERQRREEAWARRRR